MCEGGRAPVGLACCPRTLTVSGPPGPLASRDLTRAGCFWSQKVSEAAGGTGLGLRVLLGAAWRDPRGWAAPDCSPTRLRPLVSGQESDHEDTWAVVPPLYTLGHSRVWPRPVLRGLSGHTSGRSVAEPGT